MSVMANQSTVNWAVYFNNQPKKYHTEKLKFRITGGNPTMNGWFPSQRASNYVLMMGRYFPGNPFLINSRFRRIIGRIRQSSKPYLRTFGNNPRDTLPQVRKTFDWAQCKLPACTVQFGPSAYGLWVRTYNKLLYCKSFPTLCSYRAQSNEICTYGRLSHGCLPRVPRYGLLY